MVDLADEILSRMEQSEPIDPAIADRIRIALSGVNLVRPEVVQVFEQRLSATVDQVSRSIPCTPAELRLAVIGVLHRLAIQDLQRAQQGGVFVVGQGGPR